MELGVSAIDPITFLGGGGGRGGTWGGGAGFNSVCGADPGGRGRPCDLQRQVPAVQVVHVLEGPQIQFIDRVLDLPVVQRRRVPTVLLCRRPARSHRCSSWTRLMTPVVVQRQVLGV